MKRNRIVFYQKTSDIWREWSIFTDGPKNPWRGCCGNIMMISLSNGKQIMTNDLWHTNYVEVLPDNALLGDVSIYTQGVPDETYIY